jgi:hypothetical protein
MKKRTILVISITILAALLLISCGSSNPAASSANGNGSAPVLDSSTQGTGLCANAFFPLRSDKTWKYTITSGDTTSDYSLTYKDITDKSFTAVQAFPSLTNEITWQCGENGMLSSTFANMSFASQKDVSIDTLDVKGVTLPPEKDWSVGKTWESSYTVQVTIDNNGNKIQAQGTIAISSQIASNESVTVPAGTYADAYRVDSTGDMTIEMMGNKTSIPLVYSTWYVKDVGMVKSSSSDANLTYEMVLTSFE